MIRAFTLTALLSVAGAASAQEWYGRQRPVYGQPVFAPLNEKQMERLIENAIRHRMGHCVKDVDVDVELKRGKVEVEVEVRKGIPRHVAHQQAQHILHCMPELRGFRVEIEIDD